MRMTAATTASDVPRVSHPHPRPRPHPAHPRPRPHSRPSPRLTYDVHRAAIKHTPGPQYKI